jgi:hypothetical protein
MTVVEVVVTMVILGIVMAPLATALTQSMRLIPQGSQLTQRATDTSRLATLFADDVAQAQKITNHAAAGAPVVFDTAVSSWTQSSGYGIRSCATTGFLQDWVLRLEWTDLGVSGGTRRGVVYTLTVSGTGPVRTVVLNRVSFSDMATYTIEKVDALGRGYCRPALGAQPADAIGVVSTIAPGATATSESLRFDVLLRNSVDETMPQLTLQGATRVAEAG